MACFLQKRQSPTRGFWVFRGWAAHLWLRDRPGRPRGFALVVTISLMVLLALLALGLLSLSSVAVRASSNDLALSEARANARLALSIALGELQKEMGPDQRVSANAGILEDTDGAGGIGNPHWMGVWESWKAETDDSVDGYSRHQTISDGRMGGMHPTYQGGRDDHFGSWLVSLPAAAGESLATATEMAIRGDALPGKDSTGVRLVGEGTIARGGSPGNAVDWVNAPLLKVGSGRFGWWVGDESQKARILADPYVPDPADSDAELLFRHQAPGATGTTTIAGLEGLTDDTQLAGLPSLLTLDLLEGATGQPSRGFHHVTPFSYSVLADVREGGLKRDLSTLLERPIVLEEDGDEFMLYRFNEKERVPIQDLAAHHQLYHQAIGNAGEGNEGVQYASGPLSSGMQLPTPDYGRREELEKFHRQYTGLYRSPVPVKFQFMLGLQSRPRDAGEITPDYPDAHELTLTITLAITLWNPTNLPLVMDNRGRLFQRMRWWDLPLRIVWDKNGWSHEADLKKVVGGNGNFAYELDISRDVPLVFAPGEVKVLSLPYRENESLFFARWDGDNSESKRLLPGWDPGGFTRLQRAGVGSQSPHLRNHRILFSEDDRIRLTINAAARSRNAMLIQLGQDSFHDIGGWGLTGERTYYNYTLASRDALDTPFNEELMMRGFRGNQPITVDIPIQTLINGSANGEPWPFLNFSLMAGTETHESVNPSGVGGASGRKFAARPFLHSSAIRPSTIDEDTPDALYNYGWHWWIEEINSIFEAPVQVTPDGMGGYYGGGYGPTFGTTHIVQQEIPVVPPMSIAALSHAHLGGYSLSDSAPRAPWQEMIEPAPLATGRGGLFPHTLQAIGNSYAHPALPAGEAYDVGFQRTFRAVDGATSVVFADHSYLANKALWDEFFFSSLSPQPATAEIFGGQAGREVDEIARSFFFGDAPTPLPNRRIMPYLSGLDEDRLEDLLNKSGDWRDGLADRIAAHLMVEGPFNVNSTSVEAWKVVLSSLRGKPVAYLDKESATQGGGLTEEKPEGTPVAGFTMPNASPAPGGSPDPADPEQWLGWRELDEDEIEALAEAIVRQVRLRGPFLSLSEFVNRRLDATRPELSVKGALQAALDDPQVPINEGFRAGVRRFTDAEIGSMNPAFPEALEGPVAYGSAAYVDQADILRNLAGQLTPRGDTFVIRTYGDSVDATGKVRARAWCEAVVQRLPDYLDPIDEPHLPTADLEAEMNRTFGRKMAVVSFRWLAAEEV